VRAGRESRPSGEILLAASAWHRGRPSLTKSVYDNPIGTTLQDIVPEMFRSAQFPWQKDMAESLES
jgi:hypothetical protein